MKTSKLFEKEINFIKNEHMRNIVSNTLDASPECIQVIPSSSSKRYHPEYAVVEGKIIDDDTVIEGGLVKHIKATVGIAYSMIEAGILDRMIERELKDYDELYNDVVYASLILHDCCKPNINKNNSTRFDHPLVGADLFNKATMEYVTSVNMTDEEIKYIKTTLPLVIKCISSHMGKWNTTIYEKNIVLPIPRSNIEDFVHICDYLASRKFLIFDFANFNGK